MDEKDNLPLLCVGEWAEEKIERVKRYVDITGPTRRKFIEGSGGATYIDLFSGPGKARVKLTERTLPGCVLTAAESAAERRAMFTEFHIGDARQDWIHSTSKRLNNFNANLKTYAGPARETAKLVRDRLNPFGLHFVLLDPYNLANLDFSIFVTLGKLKRVDFLVHVSLMELQRNLTLYENSEAPSALDAFAPGWKDTTEHLLPQKERRRRVLKHWQSMLEDMGFEVGQQELVRGSKNQNLYLLAFASRDPQALRFWDEIRNVSSQRRLL
jgi:three-Cys-motif partner protein